jgi:hypothetical protein
MAAEPDTEAAKTSGYFVNTLFRSSTSLSLLNKPVSDLPYTVYLVIADHLPLPTYSHTTVDIRAAIVKKPMSRGTARHPQRNHPVHLQGVFTV